MAQGKSSRAVIGARLLHSVDDYLRKKQRGRGDMSNLIREAVDAVDLSSVDLIRIHGKRQTPTAKATQVVITSAMRRELERWSAKRDCTMNELLNSALVASLLKGRARDGSRLRTSVSRSGKMTAKERLEFFGAMAVLTGLEPGPDPRSRMGSHYEYDAELEATIEVTKQGGRYVVEARDGGELVRVSEVGQDLFLEKGSARGWRHRSKQVHASRA